MLAWIDEYPFHLWPIVRQFTSILSLIFLEGFVFPALRILQDKENRGELLIIFFAMYRGIDWFNG